MDHLTKFEGAILGIARIATVELLVKTAKGIVSFVSNLLPSPTPKEGVRSVPKAFRLRELFQTAGIVGIGLLASPFLVQADEEADQAPEVSCLWVENHGSIGFDVDFDVSVPWEEITLLDEFQLWQDGVDGMVDDGSPRSDTLKSKAPNQDWLSIPGFDGGPPLPYPGYGHSFNYTVKALKAVDLQLIPLGGSPPLVGFIKWETFWVDISLYVTVNSNGSLRSMSAYAYDSDGDFYEVPLYYSPGGSENFRTFED